MIEPGTLVGGFRVEELIGKGGMASVYRAVQVRLDRRVALKVLSPALAADEQFFHRFQLEGINSARLDHRNIVPIYEAGEDGGYAFLAMKLIEGQSFSAALSQKRLLSPQEAIPVLTDVSRALDYAHATGFVHRDVKPANVLIDRGGHVFLTDFGLSKDMGTRGITSTGQWMGTAEYMAPEQAAGAAIDYRADLYALGCMAYECLTGDPPFLGDSALAVMMAHTNNEVPSATERNRDLAGAIDVVLLRAMAKDPERRFPAALAFVDALEAAAEGRPLTDDAEPADGYRRFRVSAAGTGASPPPDTFEDAPSWPMSVPPQPSVGVSPPPPANLFCPRCLEGVETSDLFCGGCGVRIFWCRSCRSPRVGTDRYCQICGASSDFRDRP